jgi:hypothetical protein
MSDIATIDCGYLAVVQAMLEDKWVDPVQRNNYIADVEVAKAVLENQQVSMTELTTGGKDRKLSVEWQQKCSITTSACSDDCTITGDDVEPVCKEYDITCLQETSFQVPEKAYRERTIDKQKAIAENMLLHMKAMDEYVAAYVMAGIDANIGTNVHTGAPGVAGGDGATYIAANYWTESIFGYLKLVEAKNKFRGTYLIDGENLYQMLFNKMYDGLNADGKGGAAKANLFKIYSDLVNIETLYPKSTYMLHKTAVAFLSKTWYPFGAGAAIRKPGDTMVYSIASQNLPGVNYDVIVKSTCSGNEWYDAYKLQLNGLFAVNPSPCDDGNTGILKFNCGSPA